MKPLQIVPTRRQSLAPGYYVARRRDWPQDRPWTLVALSFEDAGPRRAPRGVVTSLATAEDEPARGWRFHSRILGVETLPAAGIAHQPIEDAVIAH